MPAAAYQQSADIGLGFSEMDAYADKRHARFGVMW
jgi:hypothetical protein